MQPFVHSRKISGLSLLEILIAVLILGLIFLFILPVFITSSKGVYQERMILRASSFSQGLAERIKQVSSTVYDATTDPPTYFYNVLNQIYSPSAPYANSSVFNGTSFLANRSYIVVNDEDAGNNIRSKRLTMHLEWGTTIGFTDAASYRRSFNFVTYLSRPANSWALTPGLPPTSSSTSSVSTSSIPTTSISTIYTSSISTSSISTTSILTTSISTIPKF